MIALRAVVAEAFERWQNDHIPEQAAALAYYAMFSLAPLLVIAIGVAGVVLGHDQARSDILAQTSALLGPAAASALETVMGSRDSAPKAGALSTVLGLVALLIGAAAVLGQLRASLNTVWDVQVRADESWLVTFKKQVASFALVVATGFLLLVSLVASAVLGAASSVARRWLPAFESVWYLVDIGAGVVMAAAIFALIFKTLPETRVRWGEVAVGAMATAVLFTLGRVLLGWYLGGWGSTSAYGAAGSVLAFMVWVYYTAQLVLFGAEFTFVYARRQSSRPPAAQEVS